MYTPPPPYPEYASAPVFPPPIPTTPDERTMATLANVLQLFGGWIGPLIIFFMRRESKFVSFHALQVLLFHLCLIAVWMVAGMAFFIGIFASVFGAAEHNTPPWGLFVVIPLFWLVIIAGGVTMFVLAIVYGIKASNGEWAMYPVTGKWARRILKI